MFSEGLDVPLLGNKQKIHPLFHVWTPTDQNYLNLFEEYLAMEKLKGDFGLDVGCGTGVLGLALAQ